MRYAVAGYGVFSCVIGGVIRSRRMFAAFALHGSAL
jgi:hypothetical protein